MKMPSGVAAHEASLRSACCRPLSLPGLCCRLLFINRELSYWILTYRISFNITCLLKVCLYMHMEDLSFHISILKVYSLVHSLELNTHCSQHIQQYILCAAVPCQMMLSVVPFSQLQYTSDLSGIQYDTSASKLR